jgi:hypothetical protein
MKTKQLITICLTVIGSVLLASCAKKAEEAAEYNDSIVRNQMSIISAFDMMDSTFRDTLAPRERVEFLYANLQTQAKRGLLALDSVGSFEKDPSLQLAAKDLFKVYQSLIDHEYQQLVAIKLLPAESISVALSDSSSVVQQRIYDMSKASQDRFLKSQEDFGKKYNLRFE